MSNPPATQRTGPGETVRLGFMPLLDAAIPVVAARRGFAHKRGIEIELVRESSWANVRDRLAIGHFDAAHALAPMPIAAALGLTPHDVPLVAPMALGTGGNAITVSGDLWLLMRDSMPDLVANDPVSMGRALRAAIDRRARAGGKPLVFGVVHPFSSHNYELRYWLSASGIDPDADLRIAILSPPYMPDALAAGRIDGFCVGEPWNTRAARGTGGGIILTKQAIWPASPEKVLAMRADWADSRTDLVIDLIAALMESARWCADPANRADLVAVMCEMDILGTADDDLLPALSGQMDMADGRTHTVSGTLEFFAGEANTLTSAHLDWYHRQMIRWGQVTPGPDDAERIGAILRPALYGAARAKAGLGTPVVTREGPGRLFDEA